MYIVVVVVVVIVVIVVGMYIIYIVIRLFPILITTINNYTTIYIRIQQ